MQRSPQSLNWAQVLAQLRSCTGESVFIRDGNVTEPADSIRNRPSAKGEELCLFPGESAVTRSELLERLEALSKGARKRFMTSARAFINGSGLIIASVSDEDIDGAISAVVKTRRPVLGFNQSQQVGATTTLRSKRIKTG